jgi:hypothetical protein
MVCQAMNVEKISEKEEEVRKRIREEKKKRKGSDETK